MIAIVDYGGGNTASLLHALRAVSVEARLTARPEEILGASAVILPGVGNFGDVMTKIMQRALFPTLQRVIAEGKPVLGICVGMQILFEWSEESPTIPGLGVCCGTVRRFTEGKIPQIGWNRVLWANSGSLGESALPSGEKSSRLGEISSPFMYYVNSFYVNPTDRRIIVAESNYYHPFPAVICQNALVGVQFHPEKSGSAGLQFLARWVAC